MDFIEYQDKASRTMNPKLNLQDTIYHVPMPKKWSDAGLVESESFSLAWRVLDAQYFGCTVYDGDRGNVLLQGTPQRRRRIYAVADFRGLSASQILFNAKGLPRHTEPSSEARESIARSLAESIGETGE